MRWHRAETVEEESRRAAGVYERMAKDARQFLRAGFVETTYSVGGFLYLTAGMMQPSPPMRIASTAGIRAGLTKADGQLLQELKNMFDREERTRNAELSGTLVIEALNRRPHDRSSCACGRLCPE